ncbi:MAG TPA: endonuclease III, partial [Pirellulaceae bacterium]|nr:endonuclease III [Pirellulaceae bacterium]
MQRAELVQNELDRLYPDVSIPLDHVDPYTLLIAVLLSAQCTDVRVNQVTPKLFAKANTPQAMARLPVGKIEDIIRPCGLAPQKSRAISQLSKILLDKHAG